MYHTIASKPTRGHMEFAASPLLNASEEPQMQMVASGEGNTMDVETPAVKEEPEETEEQKTAREAERKAQHGMDAGKVLERGIGHLRDSESTLAASFCERGL